MGLASVGRGLGFESLEIAEEGVEGCHPGDAEARPAIQKTELKDKAAAETPRGTNHQVERAHPASLRAAASGEVVRVANGLFNLVVHAFHAVVQQIGREISDRAFDFEPIMRIDSAPTGTPALPQAR